MSHEQSHRKGPFKGEEAELLEDPTPLGGQMDANGPRAVNDKLSAVTNAMRVVPHAHFDWSTRRDAPLRLFE